MAELALIVTNVLDRAVGAPAEGAVRLPALELLFARAEREPLNTGWREWLAARIGASARGAPAELAALAFREGLQAPDATLPGVHHWLATPLHFFVGIDSVHLHPEGVLQLSAEEQQRLAAEFARVFAGSQWSLSAVGERELLVTGPPLYASAEDPLLLLSRAPEACLPRGPDANALRRLGSEIELWLHEHPLNLERTRRGQLPVTGLWLWGGALQAGSESGSASTPIVASAMPLLYGRDTYAEACWRLRSEPTRALPESWQAEPTLARSRRDQIVLWPLHLGEGLMPALLELEGQWLAPLIAAVRKRAITRLYVLLAGQSYRLTWHHCIRVWRTRAPWWEELR